MERRAAYPELNTLHLENVANITVYSHNITKQKKNNGREGYCQEDCRIPLDKNEANKSIIVSKTIVPNANEKIAPNASRTIEPNSSKKIDPNASNKIEKNASKKKGNQNKSDYI